MLLEGVFQTKEAARQYASFYVGKDVQNLAEKSQLKLYLEDKYFTIFEKYQKNNLAHCLWEVLLTVLLEPDTIR